MSNILAELFQLTNERSERSMNDFEKAVRKALIDRDMKLTDLADQLEISVSYLYDILNENRKAEHQKKKIIEILKLEGEFE